MSLIPNTTESDVQDGLNFHTLIGTVLYQNVFTQLFALAYMDQDVFSHWCHSFGLVGCQQIEIVELRSSRALSREELSKGQFLLVAINPLPSLTATGQEATYTSADKLTTTNTDTTTATAKIATTTNECPLFARLLNIIASIAKSALHKCPGKWSLNVSYASLVCPVSPDS